MASKKKQDGEKSSNVKSFRKTFEAFLRESSIHGLSYVAQRRGGKFQSTIWTVAVLLAFALAIFLVRRSLSEARDFPIITTVESVSVREVPFPAVTINAGDAINPWGPTEKLFRLVDYECYDAPFDCPAEREAPREDLHFLLKVVAERFFEGAFVTHKWKDVKELENWRKQDLQMSTDYVFPEFKESVALLAHILQKKQSRGGVIRRKLAEATAKTFAKFTKLRQNDSKGWGSMDFYPIVVQEAGWLDIKPDDSGVKECLKDEESCPGTYNDAYVIMLLPFMFNRVPYEDLGLGDFISYFASRVTTLKVKKINDTFPFLDKEYIQNEERLLAEYLTKVFSQMGNIELNITSYELSKLLDKPYSLEKRAPQAFYVAGIFGCNDNLGDSWTRAWKSYLGQWAFKNTIALNFVGEVEEPPCSNATLDDMLGITGCCDMTRPLKSKLKLMMKYMKYTMQPPHFMQSSDELVSDISFAKETFPGYQMKLLNRTTFWNQNPRIFSSQYDYEPKDENAQTQFELFVRSFTNEGFGYTFNNRHFWSKHQKENNFNKLFHGTMHPFLDRKYATDLHFPKMTGPQHGLNIIVQLNKYEREVFQDNAKSFPTFRVAIHDPYAPADLRGTGIDIRPGHISTFLITPSQVKTSSAIEGLSMERRKCRFLSENKGLKIFSNYTQDACFLECKLMQSAKKCLCIPWNYPRFDLSTDICDYQGIYCFEEVKFTCRVSNCNIK